LIYEERVLEILREEKENRVIRQISPYMILNVLDIAQLWYPLRLEKRIYRMQLKL